MVRMKVVLKREESEEAVVATIAAAVYSVLATAAAEAMEPWAGRLVLVTVMVSLGLVGMVVAEMALKMVAETRETVVEAREMAGGAREMAVEAREMAVKVKEMVADGTVLAPVVVFLEVVRMAGLVVAKKVAMVATVGAELEKWQVVVHPEVMVSLAVPVVMAVVQAVEWLPERSSVLMRNQDGQIRTQTLPLGSSFCSKHLRRHNDQRTYQPIRILASKPRLRSESMAAKARVVAVASAAMAAVV